MKFCEKNEMRNRSEKKCSFEVEKLGAEGYQSCSVVSFYHLRDEREAKVVGRPGLSEEEL